MEKGEANSIWYLIAIVLGLAILVFYSFMSGGIVKKTLVTLGVIQGDNDLRLKCMVEPGTGGDTDGDGIVNSEECKKFEKTTKAS